MNGKGYDCSLFPISMKGKFTSTQTDIITPNLEDATSDRPEPPEASPFPCVCSVSRPPDTWAGTRALSRAHVARAVEPPLPFISACQRI